MSRPHHKKYPTPKKTLVGISTVGQPSPAWKQRAQQKREGYQTLPHEAGSRVLISHLPPDVAQADIEELLSSTIGPLDSVSLIYNSSGQSKGMALAHFKRQADARKARASYHGKIIDGRRPIHVDLVNDRDDLEEQSKKAPSTPQAPLTLKQRLEGQLQQPQPLQKSKPLPNGTANQPQTMPTQPKRMKKGPRLAQKRSRLVMSHNDLDKEMDDYRRAAKFGTAT